MKKVIKWKIVLYVNLLNFIFLGLILNLHMRNKENFPLFDLYNTLTDKESFTSQNIAEINKYFMNKQYERKINLYNESSVNPFEQDIVIFLARNDFVRVFFKRKGEKKDIAVRYGMSPQVILDNTEEDSELAILIKTLLEHEFIYPYIRFTTQMFNNIRETIAYSEHKVCKINTDIDKIKEFFIKLIRKLKEKK